MDGGAYCTLTPVVLSRGALHAGGPYRCPNVRIRARATRDEHAAQRRVPRLRGAAGRVRGRDAAQPDRRGARDVSPLEIRRRNVYRVGDTTPTGQVLREQRGRRGGPRAGRRGRRVRARARAHDAARAPSGPAPCPARRCDRRERSPAGSASPSPGTAPGSPGRARSSSRSVASLELTADGADPDPDRLDRDGPGDQDDLPAARRRRARASPIDAVEIAPQDTAFVPDSGPTVASRTAMVVGGLLIKAARRLRAEVEARDRPPVRRDLPRRRRATTARRGSTSGSSRTRASTSTTRPTAATPTRRSAGRPRVAEVDVDLDTGEVHGPRRRRRRRRRAGHPPGPGRGPGRGRHAPGGRLRHDRGDQAARRPLPQRPPRDVHHPDRARRAADHDDPRRGAVRRRARTAPRGSASCRWTSGRRRSSPRSTTRPGAWIHDLPASPERILAAPRRDRAARAARRVGRCRGAGRVTTYRFTVNGDPRRARRARACAACSTSSARTSA